MGAIGLPPGFKEELKPSSEISNPKAPTPEQKNVRVVQPHSVQKNEDVKTMQEALYNFSNQLASYKNLQSFLTTNYKLADINLNIGADGSWGPKTNEAIKKLAAVAVIFLKAKQDFALQSNIYPLENSDVQMLHLFDKSKSNNPSDLAKDNLKAISKIQLFMDRFNKYFIENPNNSKYINGNQSFATISKKDTSKEKTPREVELYNILKQPYTEKSEYRLNTMDYTEQPGSMVLKKEDGSTIPATENNKLYITTWLKKPDGSSQQVSVPLRMLATDESFKKYLGDMLKVDISKYPSLVLDNLNLIEKSLEG